MTGEPLRAKVTVTNPQGFHLRPLTAFAKCALQFQSRVELCNADDLKFDGKSPLSMLTMGAEQGTELVLEVHGPDQEAALAALLQVWDTFSSYDTESPDVAGG
jgi:phosphotransferase system HPr (HPr) family protein